MTDTPKPTAVHPRPRRRCKVAGAMAVGLWWIVTTGSCAEPSHSESPGQLAARRSPRPELAAPADAWRMARAYAAGRDEAEVVLGLGASMVPLYRERTLLVIERMSFETLAAGMTVVFAGDGGWPVAHVLVRPVQGGWQAAGVANAARDATLVTANNYRGTVTKAFELTWPRTAAAKTWGELRAAPVRSGAANFAVVAP